jgi:hypothetical protein
VDTSAGPPPAARHVSSRCDRLQPRRHRERGHQAISPSSGADVRSKKIAWTTSSTINASNSSLIVGFASIQATSAGRRTAAGTPESAPVDICPPWVINAPRRWLLVAFTLWQSSPPPRRANGRVNHRPFVVPACVTTTEGLRCARPNLRGAPPRFLHLHARSCACHHALPPFRVRDDLMGTAQKCRWGIGSA